jgi:hypothetical protein
MADARRSLPLAVLLAAVTAPLVAADPPPAPAPARPAPTAAQAPRELARLLRSADGGERTRGLLELASLETAALRPVLAEAEALPGDARHWARLLLDLARGAAEPRRREFVRALLSQREVLRKADDAATRARVPPPSLPPPPDDPAGRPPSSVSVELDLRIVQARGSARALLLGPAGAPARKSPLSVSEDDLGRALAVGGADGSARLVSSPTLALVGAGDTALALTRRRSYVERYEVAKDEGGRTLVSPVVDVVEEGLRIVVAPAAPAAREGPMLHVRVDLVELKEPIDEFDAPLALPGGVRELTVRVSIPDVRSATLERVLALPAGPWTVLGALEPPVAPEDGTVVFLARTRPPREGPR